MAISHSTSEQVEKDPDVWDRSRDALDERLSMVHIEAHPDEENDANFPRNLHNVAELFLARECLGPAKRLQDCTLAFLSLVEQKPAANSVKVGRACICWTCGYCGLERSGESSDKAVVSCTKTTGICSRCGCAQTNFVNAVLSNGAAIPWLEPADVELSSAANVKVEEGLALAMKAVSISDDDNSIEIEGLDERLVSFQVLPNEGEDAHPNFPHNLHNAMEILMHANRLSAAHRLQQCTNVYLRLLEEGPKEGDVSGRAYVCFDCGHCGLSPPVTETDLPSDGGEKKACICSFCRSDAHTNSIDLILPNGKRMPWIERGAQATTATAVKQQQAAVKQQPAAKVRVKPNDPCLCGSGKKSKKCCHVGGS
jgi:hypothetical protein